MFSLGRSKSGSSTTQNDRPTRPLPEMLCGRASRRDTGGTVEKGRRRPSIGKERLRRGRSRWSGEQALLRNVSRCPSSIAQHWRACREKAWDCHRSIRMTLLQGWFPIHRTRASDQRSPGAQGRRRLWNWTPDATEVRAYVAKAAEFVAAVKGIVSGTPSASSP